MQPEVRIFLDGMLSCYNSARPIYGISPPHFQIYFRLDAVRLIWYPDELEQTYHKTIDSILLRNLWYNIRVPRIASAPNKLDIHIGSTSGYEPFIKIVNPWMRSSHSDFTCRSINIWCGDKWSWHAHSTFFDGIRFCFRIFIARWRVFVNIECFNKLNNIFMKCM